MKLLNRGLLVFTALLVAGCDAEPEFADDPPVPADARELRVAHDLRIVDSTVFAYDEGVTLAAPIAAAFDRSGRVYVLDQLASTVLRVDPATGEVLGIGREGDGPGEFRTAIDLAVSGDTLVVLSLTRMHRFALDGEILTSDPLSSSTGTPPTLNSIFGTDRGFVGRSLNWRAPPPGVVETRRDTTRFFRMGRSGDSTPLGVETYGNDVLWAHGLILPPPYSSTKAAAVLADGTVLTNPTQAARLDQIDWTGQRVATWILNSRNPSVSAADIDRWIDRVVEGMAVADPDVVRGAIEQQIPVSARPELGQVLPGLLANQALVQRMTSEFWEVETDEQVWSVVDLGDGIVTAELTFPPGFQVLAFGHRLIAGIADPQLNPVLVVYELAAESEGRIPAR